MSSKILVAYATKALPEDQLSLLVPDFKPAANLKNPDKIAEDLQTKRQAFFDCAGLMPYTSTLDSVIIADPKAEKIQRWDSEGRGPGTGKNPVCVAVANWLTSQYPDSFSNDIIERKKSGIVFIGFRPKVFLKMLGLECSLPEHAKPVPSGLWYGNADHRDIEEAVCPAEFKHLSLQLALRRRRPRQEDAAKRWDSFVANWQGPGFDTTRDIWIVTELAAQLGFLRDDA